MWIYSFSVTIDHMQDYCREAGVRNLKNQIEKIYRKSALKLVELGAVGPKQILEKENQAAADSNYEHPLTTNLLPVGGEASEKRDFVDATFRKSTVLPKVNSKAIVEFQVYDLLFLASYFASMQAQYSGDPIRVTAFNLNDYVGQPPFRSDRIYEKTPVGVVVGLAWTALGGTTLYAEAALVEKCSGKVGSAFKCHGCRSFVVEECGAGSSRYCL